MDQPLAERLRPQNLDEFLGQNKILGEQSLLRRSLENDKVPSMIFWGPPGCGKTSLAHVIQTQTRKRFIALSAVSSGVKEVKDVLSEARKLKAMFSDTILFIDEIHRFNKGQQDALLGAVEDGTVTLIGATTENPGFEVNGALLSRCQLILFAPLSKEDLRTLIFSALRDHPRGLQLKDVEVDEAVVDKLIAQSEGDARFLLNQLEWIGGNLGNRKVIDEKLLEEFQYKKPLRYDKSGEEHYNLISALHKSIRGSDPDAAIYWLHRMIQGGEDPRYILRRMIRMSMEDVGMADPNALLLATSAREAYDFLGNPEGIIALDQLAVYLALAPKSNSLEIAGFAADDVIRQTGTLPVPRAFRNSVTRVGKQLGYGNGYEYDHDSPGGYSAQEHLPKQLEGLELYHPKQIGKEKLFAERLEQLKALKKQKNGKPDETASESK